jgi:hypothetical protein
MVIQSAHWADPTVDHTRWRAIRQGDWALLFDENEIPEELYNLADDPGQTNNLIGDMQYDELLNELQTVFNYALYESDRTTDGDSIADSSDNCTLVQNNDQRDTDGDGYGNRCDPDFDNNGIVQAADLAYFKSMFFSAPGPSCCAP